MNDDQIHQDDPATHRTVSELFARVLDQSREIARAEADLVRAEAAAHARMLRLALILAGIALVFAIGAIGPLVDSAVLGLQALGVPVAFAALITGIVLILCAAILLLIANAQIRRAGQAPRKIAESLARDAHSFKETLK